MAIINRYNQRMPQDKKMPMKLFIGEKIIVVFNRLPLFTKKPECPHGFFLAKSKISYCQKHHGLAGFFKEWCPAKEHEP